MPMPEQNNENKFRKAMRLTHRERLPGMNIYTFGSTRFKYMIISGIGGSKSMLREGNLICEKPALITPESFTNFFQGFTEEAVEFAGEFFRDQLKQLRGLGYQFRHDLSRESEISRHRKDLLNAILNDPDAQKSDLAVMTAPNDIWHLSVIKIAMEIVDKSFSGNFQDLNDRGYFKTADEKIRDEIEMLFDDAEFDLQAIPTLGNFLTENNLFSQYEDRFFQLTKNTGKN